MKRKVEYLRILLTQRCNLRCFYCHREGLSDIKEKDIEHDRCLSAVRSLYNCGVRKVKLIGGEPTLYNGIVSLIGNIRALGADIDISMISNGLFDREMVKKCVSAGLDRVNISVHAFSSFRSKNSVGLDQKSIEKIKSNIIMLSEMKILSKINYVYLKNQSPDELFEIMDWSGKYGIVLDVLNYLSERGHEDDKYYISMSKIEGIIASKYRILDQIEYCNSGSLASKRLLLENGSIINLKINELRKSDAFSCCKGCEKKDICIEGIKAIRLIPPLTIKPCLYRDDNVLKLGDTFDEMAMSESISRFIRDL